MCTVTLTPFPQSESGFILTSNRDEAVSRETIPPAVYLEEGVRMLYPKDRQAGGTWIGISDKNTCVCILNGGFEKHRHQPPYRRSRGLVLKDFLCFDDFSSDLKDYDLDGIEPFTSIIVCWIDALQFFELVWDGKVRHLRKLPLHSHIWSSTPLYSEDVRRKKAELFNDFISDELTPENLMEFHSNEDVDKELIIDRGFLRTLSITQVIKNQFGIKMLYKDLLQKENPVSENFF